MIDNILEKKYAVIIIDMQNDYVHESGKINQWGLGIENIQKTLPQIEKFLDEIRKKNIPIIFTSMTEGENDIAENIKNQRNKAFGNPINWVLCEKNTWGYEQYFKPKANESIFEKNTYDIFSNLKLKKYLDENKIQTLIIIGGYTHSCVESSIRSAVTLGYEVILAADLVNSPDKYQQMHENSLKNLTNNFAYSVNSQELLRFILYFSS